MAKWINGVDGTAIFKYSLPDTLDFAENLKTLNSSATDMFSFDITSLFTNEAIDRSLGWIHL